MKTQNYRLQDSGLSGVWRKVAQVPEFTVEPAGPTDNYVQRMDHELWQGLNTRVNRLKEAYPIRALPVRKHVGCDLAVAFAVHAMGMPLGQARTRMENLCLDALESAIAAGCELPARDHPDFAVVAEHPRFLQMISR